MENISRGPVVVIRNYPPLGEDKCHLIDLLDANPIRSCLRVSDKLSVNGGDGGGGAKETEEADEVKKKKNFFVAMVFIVYFRLLLLDSSHLTPIRVRITSPVTVL